MHRNGLVSEEICMFSAGMIFTLSIPRDACPLPVPESYNNQIVQHSNTVLSMVPQANEKSGKTNGSLSLLTPLESIAMLSPDIGQREYAAAKLAKWNKGVRVHNRVHFWATNIVVADWTVGDWIK
jgi:hypothetical protein